MEGWGWQSVHDPAELPTVMEKWTASIKTGQPFEMIFPLRGADGVFQPFLTRITPLFDENGKLYRWLGTNTNIDEERQASQLREQFVAILGHDLRNPLAAIISGLGLIQKTPLNQRAAALAEMMQQSSARILGMIENLLDLARGRLGGGLAVERDAAYFLEPTLRQVIDELLVNSPQQIVETDFGLTVPIKCDRGRIAQLFSNLLGNALTHGAVDLPIRVKATSDARGFELCISNGGTPIPDDDLKRLFQPFYRVNVRPSRQGLGLGLYIAHEIATAHGGTLEVSSTREETCFTFRMPNAD